VIRRVANSQPNDHWLVSVSRCPLLVEFSLASPIKASNGPDFDIFAALNHWILVPLNLLAKPLELTETDTAILACNVISRHHGDSALLFPV
jgi:hypothetical protein